MAKDYDNSQLIERFLNHCVAMGLGNLRIQKYRQQLTRLSELLGKRFDKANREDIEKLVSKILKSDFKEWTKHDYKVSIKRFYRWLNGDEEYPKTVSWIKTGIKNHKKKLPEDLLSEDEIKLMIKHAQTVRDKAFVITLYESGCRIGELLSIKLKNVSFEKHGTVLHVSGKTGDRRVLVVMATPYLRDWINSHPLSNKSNSALWIMANGEPLNMGSVRALLQRIAGRAGIDKRVNPHNFRHTRATQLANHMTEAQMKEYLGWTQSSDMASVYVHLSGRDTDNAILKMHGLKKDTKKAKSNLKPQKCLRCQELNKATAKFCDKCGAILDFKTAIEFEQRQKDEKDILHQFVQKIVEKNPKLAKKTLDSMPEDMLKKLTGL